jgi:hypothetical protein
MWWRSGGVEAVRRLWAAVVYTAATDCAAGRMRDRDVVEWLMAPESTLVLAAHALDIDPLHLARLLIAHPRELARACARIRGGSGPRPSRTSPIMSDWGEYYDSIRDAARALGVRYTTLASAVRLGRICGGRRWYYATRR